jgi:hypothetical protein
MVLDGSDFHIMMQFIGFFDGNKILLTVYLSNHYSGSHACNTLVVHQIFARRLGQICIL